MKHKNDSPIVSYTLYNKRKEIHGFNIEDFFDSSRCMTLDIFAANQSVYIVVCLLRVTSFSIFKPFKLGDYF